MRPCYSPPVRRVPRACQLLRSSGDAHHLAAREGHHLWLSAGVDRGMKGGDEIGSHEADVRVHVRKIERRSRQASSAHRRRFTDTLQHVAWLAHHAAASGRHMPEGRA